MLKYRLITGPLLIALLLGVVWADDRLDQVTLGEGWRWLFGERIHPPRGILLFSIGLVFVTLAARELSAIFRANGVLARSWLTGLAAVTGLAVSYATPVGTTAVTTVAILSTAMVVILVLALLTFSRHQNVEGVAGAAGAAMFSLVYLGLMLGFLIALRRDHSAWWIVGVILVTKACDTGAYFTGRSIGRHKLIPWLSPGKTWEGLAGGVVLAVLVALALAAASRGLLAPGDQLGTGRAIVCGVVFALVGQFGDLAVSLFKRGAGMKDASSLLPGLGGVLDVLDSPLMVAPVAYWLLAAAP